MEQSVEILETLKEIRDILRAESEKPRVTFSVITGDMKNLLEAPAGTFAPEFTKMLEDQLPKIFIPKAKAPTAEA